MHLSFKLLSVLIYVFPMTQIYIKAYMQKINEICTYIHLVTFTYIHSYISIHNNFQIVLRYIKYCLPICTKHECHNEKTDKKID